MPLSAGRLVIFHPCLNMVGKSFTQSERFLRFTCQLKMSDVRDCSEFEKFYGYSKFTVQCD